MPPWIVVVGAVIVVALVMAPRTAAAITKHREEKQKREVADSCAAIRAAIDGLPTGSDPNTRLRLEADLRACERQLEELGEEVDHVSRELELCKATRDEVRREWSHFLSTDYADLIKRGNTRGSILRKAEAALQCLESPLEAATTVKQARAVERLASELLADSVERYNAYVLRLPGTDRYWGSLEASWQDKAREEEARVTKPARALHKRAKSKRERLEAIEKQAAESARKAAEEARRAAARELASRINLRFGA